MKDSFIGKKEIDDFLNTIDDNKESSLFKVGDQESKNTIGFRTMADSLNSHKMFGLDSYR
jgi:hypothetical protein